MSVPEQTPEQLRSSLLDGWDVAAAGWRRSAQRVREMSMPVSAWMVEHLALQPGERVLELAAGGGETGLLAAELVAPGGELISSDGSERMLAIARDRAAQQGIENVEFTQLQLEWIDLETASVDAILCRWGLMLVLDPAAALQECRRVLRPGGRIALAVWAPQELNPWATVPSAAVQALDVLPPPDPTVPGPFSLSGDGVLAELLGEAGFVDATIDTVTIRRDYPDFESFLDETLDLSHLMATAWTKLGDDQQAALLAELERRLDPFTAADGSIDVPGVTYVALAHA